MTLILFLYNVELRYALQLRHLSNKTQKRSVTRKSHIDHHDERKMPIVFQGQWSKVKVIECHLVGKCCRQDTEWTVSSRLIQLGTIDNHDERKMLIKVGGQSSRSYCHIVGNWTGYIVGRIQTELKAPGSYNMVQLIIKIRGRCPLIFKVRGQGKFIVSLRIAI